MIDIRLIIIVASAVVLVCLFAFVFNGMHKRYRGERSGLEQVIKFLPFL